MKFEEGQWVTVSGEGNEAFKIDKVDEELHRIAVNGWWESMDKCKIIPESEHNKIYTRHFYSKSME